MRRSKRPAPPVEAEPYALVMAIWLLYHHLDILTALRKLAIVEAGTSVLVVYEFSGNNDRQNCPADRTSLHQHFPRRLEPLLSTTAGIRFQ